MDVYTRAQIEAGAGRFTNRHTVIWQIGETNQYLTCERGEYPRHPEAHIAGGIGLRGDGCHRPIEWV